MWHFLPTSTFKAVLNVTAIVGIGIGLGEHLAQSQATREQVTALNAEMVQVKSDGARMAADVRAIRLNMDTQLCLARSEREHFDWRKCLEGK